MARAMGSAPASPDPAAAPAEPSESPDSSGDSPPAKPSTFDWHAAESDLGETVGPMFVDGTTEVAGIGVPGAYRRRGIGAAITAWLTGAVHGRGAHTVFLTPAGTDEQRLYARVGYRPAGEMVHLRLT